MATRILSRSRSVLSKLSLSTTQSSATATTTTASRSFNLLRHRPISTASVFNTLRTIPRGLRGYCTSEQPTSRPASSNARPNVAAVPPPQENIELEGCDFKHWLILMEKPEGDPTRDEIIDSYIKFLATSLGSEEEARMKIYSVSTRCYYGFGFLGSEDDTKPLKDLPGVRWVLPDCYLDVPSKSYGGEPFINGQAVPYDPKYHEEWIRNNAMQQKEREAKPPPSNRPPNNRSRDNARRGEKKETSIVTKRGGEETPATPETKTVEVETPAPPETKTGEVETPVI